jgi:hypothetical protein
LLPEVEILRAGTLRVSAYHIVVLHAFSSNYTSENSIPKLTNDTKIWLLGGGRCGRDVGLEEISQSLSWKDLFGDN